MNEFKWAKGIKDLFSGDRNKADFSKFIDEVSNENVEYMSFQKEFDEEVECRPSFEQLSQDRIVDELNKYVQILKSFETIIQERVQSFNLFLTGLSKAKTSFDIFQHAEGTMRQALDAFFVFIEQELQQARQQIGLGDVRKALSEVKVDAQRRMSDYQQEIAQAEKEVLVAEKKLGKTKEHYEKCLEHKLKLEGADSSDVLTNPRMPRYGRDGRSDRLREAEEALQKGEREIRDDIRGLLHALTNRDQTVMASRRAYQKLDKECRKALANTLRRIIAREKDAEAARHMTLAKLEASVTEIEIESDVNDFISRHKGSEGKLVLSSQALSILSDLAPVSGEAGTGSNSSSSKKSGGGTPHESPLSSALVVPSSSTPSRSRLSVSGNGLESLLPSPLALWVTGTSSETREQHHPSPSLLPPSGPLGVSGVDRLSEGSTASQQDEFERRARTLLTDPTSQALNSDIILHLTRLFYPSESEEKIQNRCSSMRSALDVKEEKQEQDGLEVVSLEEDATTTRQAINSKRLGVRIDRVSVRLPTASYASDPAVAVAAPLDAASSADRHAESTQGASAATAHSAAESREAVEEASLAASIDWLSAVVETQAGRDSFRTVLNKFRSRKVNVGESFGALGAVLWATLDQCSLHNDIHNAKIIMMLSQTFYRQHKDDTGDSSPKGGGEVSSSGGGRAHEDSGGEAGRDEEDQDEEGECGERRRREYLKDMLSTHSLWHSGNFWEQALWQCVIEQLNCMPYERPWHEMEREDRASAVRRVHEVIFNQVMAITHSMMELGVTKGQTREFLYRMCVIHQLEESQRHELLAHLHAVALEGEKASV